MPHREKFTSKQMRGVGIVAVMLIVAMLSTIGVVITFLVASGTVTKTNDLVREQAFGLIHAGFEYALKRADDGVNPDGDIRNLGNGQLTIDYASGGLITVNAAVSAMQGAASPSFSIQGPAVQGMNTCLTVNVAGATLAASNTSLQGITLTNTCQVAITVTGMTVSWAPAATERMTAIFIGGTQVYNNPTGALSGTSVQLIPSATIPACNGASPASLRVDFNSAMLNKNFQLLFSFSDGSQKSAFVQFVANNEAACLNVDTAAMTVGFTGNVRLLNGTLTNSCSAPTSVRIDQMTVSWTPTSPSRTRNEISIGGIVCHSSNAANDATSNLSPQVLLASGDSVIQDYIQFNNDMRGFNYTIVYIMRDATTKTVSVNLYEANMAACLTVNTAATSFSANDLVGETWQNTCPLRIVVDRVQTSWTPTSGNRRLQGIQVNGTTVFSGNLSSGGTANISDVDISGNTTFPVNFYRFNNSMTGRCITHTMTMFPSGTVSVPQFCP